MLTRSAVETFVQRMEASTGHQHGSQSCPESAQVKANEGGGGQQWATRSQSSCRDCDLVVAHCNEDLRWLCNTSRLYRRVFVYSKCGQPFVRGVPNVEVAALSNVGSCDHAYLQHIVRHWDDLAPVTVFCKGSHPERCGPQTMVRPGAVRWPDVTLRAFDQTPGNTKTRFQGLFLIDGSRGRQTRSRIAAFSLNGGYAFQNSGPWKVLQGASQFVQSRFDNLSDWLANLVGRDAAPVLLEHAHAVVYGGHFAAQAEALRRYPRELFLRMIAQQVAPNEEVDHFIERMWGLLLSNTNVPERSLFRFPAPPSAPSPHGASPRRPTAGTSAGTGHVRGNNSTWNVSGLVISSGGERYERARREVLKAGFARVELVPGVFGHTSQARAHCSRFHRGVENLLIAHMNAWRRVVATGAPAAIFEDDATFMGGAAQLKADVLACSRLASTGRCDMQYLGVQEHWRTTHAYFVSREGARKLLRDFAHRCAGEEATDGRIAYLCELPESGETQLLVRWAGASAAAAPLGLAAKLHCRRPSTKLSRKELVGVGYFGQDRSSVTPLLHPRRNSAMVRSESQLATMVAQLGVGTVI